MISHVHIQPDVGYSANLNTSDEEVIWDITHTIFSPNDQVFLQDLSFQVDWMYSFYLEVLTPHQCELNMTLIDPDGYHYNLFQGTVNQQQKEVLFGIVNEGDYNITLDVSTEFTLNLRLKIERTTSLMDLSDQNSETIAFQSFRFSENEPLREVPILLDPSDSYTFTIALITPLVNISPIINTFIDDPADNHFIIYQNQVLNEFFLIFEFETINYGVHDLQVLVDLAEDCLNLVVFVTEDDPPNSNEPPNPNILYIPIEVQLTLMGTIIIVIIISIFMKRSSTVRFI